MRKRKPNQHKNYCFNEVGDPALSGNLNLLYKSQPTQHRAVKPKEDSY